ncbi:MAG: ine55 [Candidatus Paceibacter sp.]|nr:ine55 [Candidatus Paceibacter sp.]
MIIPMYKNVGETPLEALFRLRKARPELEKETLSYAGRLDPMAEGVLLVLVGEENKNRENYLNLDKEYEATAVFGIETDSYDLLGKISAFSEEYNKIPDQDINNTLKKFVGTFQQPYPPFSSKPVKGKPLFQWAREGKLNEIEIPVRNVEIFSLELLKTYEISADTLLDTVQHRVTMVSGDFRQPQIIDSWQEKLLKSDRSFQAVTFRVKSSTGMYVRGLIHELGKNLKIGAVTVELKRTKLGHFQIENIAQLSP